MIKQILASTFMSVILLAGGLQAAMAAAPKDIVCDQVSNLDPACKTGQDRIFGPNGIVTKIIQALVLIVGGVSVIVIVVGGLMYVFSTGDPNNTKRAKDAILYAVVGLVVALFAQAIVSFVIRRIGQ